VDTAQRQGERAVLTPQPRGYVFGGHLNHSRSFFACTVERVEFGPFSVLLAIIACSKLTREICGHPQKKNWEN